MPTLFTCIPKSNKRRLAHLCLTLLLTVSLLLKHEKPLLAQETFTSGSNGSDGALNLTTPGTIIFNPRTFTPPLDADGDNIYHFTTITIGPGVTVTLSSVYIDGPVYWLATGDVQINGVIDLNGQAGYNGLNVQDNSSVFPSIPGAGGFGGGIGATVFGGTAQKGFGPGGGSEALVVNSDIGGHGGGGSHAIGTSGGAGQPGTPPYGNLALLPLIGGSGGGGTLFNSFIGASGGAGGGAILIASSSSIEIDGGIQANGGQAFRGGRGSKGGPGSGGAIHLLAPIIRGAGALHVSGGPDFSGGFGGASHGRIRLGAFQDEFTGTTDGVGVRGKPFKLFLPTQHPRIRVVSVANVNVPVVPANELTSPDITINATSSVVVTVEAHDVPVGTIAKLVIVPLTGAIINLNSTPLAGTFATSTATISATIPPGPSRMFVSADWTP